MSEDIWELVSGGPSAPQGASVADITHTEDTELQHARHRRTTGIIADLLIPGKGEPLHDQAVVAHNGKIEHIGPSNDIPSGYSRVEFQHVAILMPGMWECHAHFMGADPAKPINSENMAFANPTVAGARNVRALKDTLYAGVTSCVDLGGYAPELQKVIDEKIILGPSLYGTGGALSQTAGHGDVFEYVSCACHRFLARADTLFRVPLGSAWQKLSVNAPGTEVGSVPLLMCDGIDECRKAVRINIRRGARVIKVLTSGGATSRDDNPMYQQFSDEELAVIVSEARRMGLVCAAHAIGKAGIMAAIRAGFKVIEHNSYADDEVLKAMKDNDVMLVATMSPIQSIIDNQDSYPKPMVDKVKAFYETHKKMYRSAVKAGVKCALGSDLFGGIGTVLSPGLNGKEVPYAVKYGGMTPLQAIEAATANGPYTLGSEQAPRSGQIREGFDADFIALRQNPLDDIEILSSPKNIRYIWKAGKLVKAPGLDPWEVLN